MVKPEKHNIKVKIKLFIEKINTVTFVFALFYCLFVNDKVLAQIVPDKTLPNNSIVNQGCTICNISGGTIRGNNLFHSFNNFSVPVNGAALFKNSSSITNIISRITGNNNSVINGLVITQGKANLFLINSNGIVLGPQGSIQSGGSVFLSTASKIIFSDGNSFVTNEPNTVPILTSNIPIGLAFQNNTSSIEIQGNGHSLVNPIFMPILGSGLNSSEINLGDNSSLSISAGNILINGGILIEKNNSIFLNSINTGELDFNASSKTLNFNDSGIKNYGNISLINNALIQTIGNGNIKASANDINISSGSSIFANNNANTTQLGNITLSAIDSVNLNGTLSNPLYASSIRTENLTNAVGGNITVNSASLNVTNGGQFVARAFGSGNAGSIIINSDKTLISSYLASSPNLFSNISSATFGLGSSGDLSVNENNLTILNGGDLGSATFGFGTGGNVNININNDILISGFVPILFTPSVINAATFGVANAGNVNIQTNNLFLDSGGRISTSTVASGAAGNLKVTALNDITVTGSVPGSITPTSIDSSSSAVDPSLAQQLNLSAPPTGQSGTLTLLARTLEISNGAQVTTRNDGPGNAGILQINTTNLTSLNKASILASTNGGEGGEIKITTNNFVSQQGRIIASANGNGNGGNITFMGNVGIGDSQSYITADAVNGFGGVVDINAQYFQFPRQNITAISQRGANYNGIVNINGSTFSAIPKILASFESTKDISPLSCANYRGVAKVKNQAEFSPENTSDPIYFVDNKPQKQYYKDIRSGKILPMPEQTVWFKDNDDGTVSALSLADVQNINESFLKSQCFPATQAASKT